MTGAQVREARRLLGWSADRLNAWADLPTGIVEEYEKTDRIRPPAKYEPPVDRLLAIRNVLEEAGVQFVNEVRGGPGVRLASRDT